MSDVLVVGAGPVGLTMAAELARHGVACRIIDRLAAPSPFCRAIGVTPRTLEVWEDMGIAREMIDAGLWIRGLRSIVHGHPTREEYHEYPELPYAELGLPQYETERVLIRHLSSMGIDVERGATLASLVQNEHEVAARIESEDKSREHTHFRYVVGCDGAHSAVRRQLGIDFEGDAFPMSFMLGDVHIDWDLPRGLALRALRLVEDSAPDMFIAIPLPEPGRYRVSMLAPPELAPEGGTGHGIQSEMKGPSLEDLQAVATDLVPDTPRLSDLRWSSIFRISMRLAKQYRVGRCFIAGDAAHIHPPTGGQGMNTGIQDAYNLAWKLALVLRGKSPGALLESYEAERRPVGADVVTRTRAASEGYGREGAASRPKPNPLENTQVLVSYRGSEWVIDAGAEGELQAGDRAPDCTGLRRMGVGYPLRLFDCLRGTEHVLLVTLAGSDLAQELTGLEAFAAELKSLAGDRVRIVAISADPIDGLQPAGVCLMQDAEGAFARVYGGSGGAFLVRPDGYLGWRGGSWNDSGLMAYFRRLFSASEYSDA